MPDRFVPVDDSVHGHMDSIQVSFTTAAKSLQEGWLWFLAWCEYEDVPTTIERTRTRVEATLAPVSLAVRGVVCVGLVCWFIRVIVLHCLTGRLLRQYAKKCKNA